MQPKDNSMNLSSNLSNRLLKILYKEYNSKHDSTSNLSSHPFLILHLRDNPQIKGVLLCIKELSKEFDTYSNDQVLSTALNSLVRGNTVDHTSGKYYLNEAGYRQGLKKTNILKFWSRFHPSSFYPSSLALLGIVVAILIP
jgi:hypothetical protein